eukprot:3925869-Prymnesium_polylepis.1
MPPRASTRAAACFFVLLHAPPPAPPATVLRPEANGRARTPCEYPSAALLPFPVRPRPRPRPRLIRLRAIPGTTRPLCVRHLCVRHAPPTSFRRCPH